MHAISDTNDSLSGLAVAAKAVTVAVTGVATAAVHAARAPARKLETDHQSPRKSHQVNQKEDTTKKTTDTMIDAVANVTTMKITTIGALLPVRDLGRVHDLVPSKGVLKFQFLYSNLNIYFCRD